MFDQIQFYPVKEDELNILRSQFKMGKFVPEMSVENFNLKEYSKLLESIDSQLQAQRSLQAKASAEQNQLEAISLKKLKLLADSDLTPPPAASDMGDIPANCDLITAQITSLVNKVCVSEGMKVTKGDKIAILEAMKANFNVTASESGVITKLMVSEGAMIQLGGPIALITLDDESTSSKSNDASSVNANPAPHRYSLQIESLHETYKNGIISPSDIVEQIFSQIQADGGSKQGNVWIELGDKRKVCVLSYVFS